MSVAGPAAPQRLCTVTDPRLDELSGLIAIDDGSAFWAMPDGGRGVAVYRIDPATCAITDTRTADIDPFDAEDLASGPGGALWVGDIGDNARSRDTVAVIELPERGGARLVRLTYPDGPHDAEALLVDGQGRPVIVTKEGSGSGVYRTDSAPRGTGPTPLRRLGTVSLPASDGTSGPLGGLGSRLVTGAAATPDGRMVALRSYTDAWLYPVRDGDVAAAVTGSAVRVPLPDEPQGEAIAFDAEGTLYSSGETRGGTPGELRAVPGAAGLVGDPAAGVAPAEAPQVPAPPEQGTPTWLPAVVGGGVGVVLLVLLAGALAVRGARRR